jgi:hypothetical protein
MQKEQQVPDRAGKFKHMSRRAVIAGEGSSREFYHTYLPFL